MLLAQYLLLSLQSNQHNTRFYPTIKQRPLNNLKRFLVSVKNCFPFLKTLRFPVLCNNEVYILIEFMIYE